MKRQFKAGAQAKREVKQLEKKVDFIKGKYEHWRTQCRLEEDAKINLRDTNIELKAEMMKLENKCKQLEEQKKYFAAELKEFRINDSKAAETLIRQSKIMQEQQQANDDLRFAYDNVKHTRDWLAGVVLAYVFIKIIFWVW